MYNDNSPIYFLFWYKQENINADEVPSPKTLRYVIYFTKPFECDEL